MPNVKNNDINIYYEVHGEGFPLLMITGWGATTLLWDPQLIPSLYN